MTLLAVPGAELYFETDGRASAPALLLLPAGIASLRMWDAQLGMLAEEHFVIRMDYRGVGSTHADGGAPFAHRDDVIALLDHLGVPRATLIGASFGGIISIDTALERPERVAGLVTVGSGPSGFPRVELTPAEQAVSDAIDAAAEAGDWERVVELETAIWAAGPERPVDAVDPAFYAEALALGRANLPVIEFDAPERPLDPPAYGRVDTIQQPMLATVGALDVGPAIRQQRYLVDHVPGATGHVFEDSAHLPNLERRHEFDEVLAAWLGEHAL